jgi:hypothetical protein
MARIMSVFLQRVMPVRDFLRIPLPGMRTYKSICFAGRRQVLRVDHYEPDGHPGCAVHPLVPLLALRQSGEDQVFYAIAYCVVSERDCGLYMQNGALLSDTDAYDIYAWKRSGKRGAGI